MNEFEWMKRDICPSEITQWSEYHLREHLKQSNLKVEVFSDYYPHSKYSRGIWDLCYENKKYTIGRKYPNSNTIRKERYKLEQIIRYLNREEWVIKCNN